MNTDRNFDAFLINCEIKDTFLNTDELCVQGHICEHYWTVWLQMNSSILSECANMDIFQNADKLFHYGTLINYAIMGQW